MNEICLVRPNHRVQRERQKGGNRGADVFTFTLKIRGIFEPQY